MFILKLLLILAAIILIYMYFEAGFVKKTEIRLSKGSKALKIIQLSDIHIGYLKVPIRKAKNIIASENPDIIVLTGDYIQSAQQVDAFLDFLDNIKTCASIFLCLGNHDYRAFSNDKDGFNNFIKSIENRGVTVLDNKAVLYQMNSKIYNIIGIKDIQSAKLDMTTLSSLVRKDVHANIAITHNPDIVLDLPAGIVDYLFGGHFHGGQIWAPFNIEFRLMRKERLCKMKIVRGLHKINGIVFYINRGLGNVCVPLRFLSRPEITVFYLP